MRINNNISALNAWRNLTFTDMAMGKNLEKLSSGLRINRAADDAAGLAISEQMRGQIRGLNQAVRNAQDGISLIQTAEGALTETHAILQRMRELSVQAANDTYTDSDRNKLQLEVQDLIEELDRIAGKTQFNGQDLLTGQYGATFALDGAPGDGGIQDLGVSGVAMTGAKAGDYTILADTNDVTVTFTDADGNEVTQTLNVPDVVGGTKNVTFDALGITITFDANYGGTIDDGSSGAIALGTVAAGTGGTLHVGANSGDTITVSIGNMSTGATGLNVSDVDIEADADAAITRINEAINTVSQERARLGAKQNRLEHTIANLSVAAENLTAAESRIRDVDMAQEMTKFTRNQILLQAGTAMLAQANMAPQSVLQLLR